MSEATTDEILGQRSLVQQGYDFTTAELRELQWGLRFTPAVCMLGAIVGLILQEPAIHFTMAALGIVPFWFPAWHPMDRLYNHVLRPLWSGVVLPANPLPRRIACFSGGAANVAVAVSFLADWTVAAYVFGAMLIALQLIVITTHFCVASWVFEAAARISGRWKAPITSEQARSLVSDGAQLVDVRSPEEFAGGHIDGAINLPVDSIGDRGSELSGRTVVMYCRSGMRSRKAANSLARQGHDAAHDMGAMDRW